MQIPRCRKRLRTNFALIRFFAGVCSDVPPEIAGAHESLGAVRTFVGLLPGMGQHVSLKVGELGKSPGTHLADVRFFPCMYTVMNLEVSGQHERLRTFFAFVRLLP
jgi:hypothetical protein